MKEEIKFSEILKKLRVITERLDRGDLELEEALKLYEDGISLHKKALEKLNRAKLRFEELKKY